VNSPEHDSPQPVTMAQLADPHRLYQKSVQSPDHDIALLAGYFEAYTKQPLRHFREDFCGTAFLSAYFVTRHPDNHALGIDLDWPTLNWGLKHNVAHLPPDQQQRLTLVNDNVLNVQHPLSQLTVAMNFSYMVFRDRPTLLHYFTNARRSLQPGGLFVLDIWGGSETQVAQEEHRDIDNPDDDGIGDFIFVWDQDVFEPSTYFCRTRIHFIFRDGSELRDAFVYDWRLWTMPEVIELMKEAGFADVHFLWEGTNLETHEGTGTYHRAETGDSDPSWIAYVVGQNPG
jgi:SAM-dependent methyltransferase